MPKISHSRVPQHTYSYIMLPHFIPFGFVFIFASFLSVQMNRETLSMLQWWKKSLCALKRSRYAVFWKMYFLQLRNSLNASRIIHTNACLVESYEVTMFWLMTADGTNEWLDRFGSSVSSPCFLVPVGTIPIRERPPILLDNLTIVATYSHGMQSSIGIVIWGFSFDDRDYRRRSCKWNQEKDREQDNGIALLSLHSTWYVHCYCVGCAGHAPSQMHFDVAVDRSHQHFQAIHWGIIL